MTAGPAPTAVFHVLISHAGNRTLWTGSTTWVPPGWDVEFGPADAATCAAHLAAAGQGTGRLDRNA